jgi:hypothetical protein
MARLIAFKRKAGLSRDAGNELLTLIKSFNPSVQIPNDWRRIQRHVVKKCKYLKETTLRRLIEYPASWRFDLWSEPGSTAPGPREIIARDPLQLIAQKLVCPTTQFINVDRIQYEYKPEFLDDGTPCVTNLMSSEWAKWTSEEIKGYNTDGILIPIINYVDGVSLGLRNKVSVCSYRVH